MKLIIKDEICILKADLDDEYLITDRNQLLMKLKGEDAKYIVENIIPLLNGTNDENDIIQKTVGDFTEQDIQGVLKALVINGILTTIPDEVETNSSLRDILTLLKSEYSQAFSRLQEVRLLILGPKSVEPELAIYFNQFPFKSICIEEHENIFSYKNSFHEIDFCIFIDDNIGYPHSAVEFNKLALNSNTSWLYSHLLTSSSVLIGPIFSGGSVCFDCFLQRLQQGFSNETISFTKEQTLLKQPRLNHYGVKLIMYKDLIETLKYLLFTNDETLENRFMRLNLNSFEQDSYTVLPVPYCHCIGSNYLAYQMYSDESISGHNTDL
jgi:hypothetical protein